MPLEQYQKQNGQWVLQGVGGGNAGGSGSSIDQSQVEQIVAGYVASHKDELKGDKGDALTFDDLTDSQKESLKGEKGDTGTFKLDRAMNRKFLVPQGTTFPYATADHVVCNDLPKPLTSKSTYKIASPFGETPCYAEALVYDGTKWVKTTPGYYTGSGQPRMSGTLASCPGDGFVYITTCAVLCGEAQMYDTAPLSSATAKTSAECVVMLFCATTDVAQGGSGGGVDVDAVNDLIDAKLDDIEHPKKIYFADKESDLDTSKMQTDEVAFIGAGPLEFLKGDTGTPGKSAYEIAVDNGFVGTEKEWLASLGGVKHVPQYTAITVLVPQGTTYTAASGQLNRLSPELPLSVGTSQKLQFDSPYGASDITVKALSKCAAYGTWHEVYWTSNSSYTFGTRVTVSGTGKKIITLETAPRAIFRASPESNTASPTYKALSANQTEAEIVLVVSLVNAPQILPELTDERIIGYIEGKPVYERLVKTTTPSANNGTILNTNSWDVEDMISITGFNGDTGNNWYSSPYYNGSSSITNPWWNKPTGNVNMSLTSGAMKKPLILVLRYTKTTD